jgi:hypothetical protein
MIRSNGAYRAIEAPNDSVARSSRRSQLPRNIGEPGLPGGTRNSPGVQREQAACGDCRLLNGGCDEEVEAIIARALAAKASCDLIKVAAQVSVSNCMDANLRDSVLSQGMWTQIRTCRTGNECSAIVEFRSTHGRDMNMARHLRMIAGVIALAGIFRAASASDQLALIDNIQVANDGRIIVTLVGTRTSKPSCASFDYWLVTDEASNAGKAQLALLIAAHNAGHQVQIFGTGTCVRWPDGENILAVREYGA